MKVLVDVQTMLEPPVGPWKIADLRAHKIGAPKNGLKVFSCFHCGGGSTMGYKLAGYDVLGGIEIDPEMMALYRKNHSPREHLSLLMPIQDFPAMDRSKLPSELFELDVLDGSPPCSSFSMAGSREDAWTEKKAFREGQTEQVLDDLFFHFIKVADILRPKVVIAENVKGLIIGAARGYVKEIFRSFDAAGYSTQLFLLNASRMGVPQARERTFFIARRKDLALPKIALEFTEKPIPFKAIDDGDVDDPSLKLTPTAVRYWSKCMRGKSFSSVHEKGSLFNWLKVDPNKPLNTLASGNARLMFHWKQPRVLTNNEWIRGQTFPDDYDFGDADPRYVCGMSVPPFMMNRVASAVRDQLLLRPPGPK